MVPRPRSRPRLRVLGSVVGIAVTGGPVVGGTITDAFGWPWIFLLNLAVGVGLIALALVCVPESSDPRLGPIDLAGTVLLGASLFLLIRP